MVTIEFTTDNAAFEDDRAVEIARILRDLADKILLGRTSGPIRDINGNRVGTFDAED